MPKLVFCMDCGECLGEDRELVAKEHLQKFPNHTSFLTKNVINPFSLDDIDQWIFRKITSTKNLLRTQQPKSNTEKTTDDETEPKI